MVLLRISEFLTHLSYDSAQGHQPTNYSIIDHFGEDTLHTPILEFVAHVNTNDVPIFYLIVLHRYRSHGEHTPEIL